MSEKTCGKCGQKGHNVRSCGKPKVTKEPSELRHCRVCGGIGHNVRSCQKVKDSIAQEAQESAERKTLAEIGREILATESEKATRIEVDGVKPKRGLWLANPVTHRCAGLIAFIRRSGQVVWKDFDGILVDSEQDNIIRSGYKYMDNMPTGDEWVYLHLGGWNHDPIMKEIVIGSLDTLG